MMKANDLIIQTTAKLLVFIILTFGIYIFFAGHNNPGGGFVGGLITAASVVLLMIAFDLETVKKMIPFDFTYLIGIGMLFAIFTGAGAFLFEVEFLTHTFGSFTIPIIGEIELATATLFDVGVYFVVVGATLTIIQTIGEDE